MAASNDEVLLTLLSMGFEYEDCEKVIQDGACNVEDAIQRIISPTDKTSMKEEEVSGIQHQSSPSQNIDSDISSQKSDSRQKKLKSRFELSFEHTKQIEEFEQRKREDIEASVKKQKMEDQKIRKNILKDIEADRQLKRISIKSETVNSTLSISNNEAISSNTSMCKLQIRLQSGSSLSLSYNKECSLQVVYDHIKQNSFSSNTDFYLVQPFPKRIFTQEDLSDTLENLHLFPSAMLVVQENKPLEQFQEFTGSTSEHDEPSRKNDIDDDKSNGENNSLQASKSNDLHASNQFQGSNQQHNANAKIFCQAIENRMKASCLKETAKPSQVFRDIPSLQKLSATCVAYKLLHIQPAIVNSMWKISSLAASTILAVLKDKRKLTPTILALFLPCKLKEIQLDFYLLTTNDLLEKLRWHTNITKLSLKSCTCITDTGLIAAIKGLYGLKYLNVSECVKLTGTILHSIADLAEIQVLILDKTKVKNADVQQFLKCFVSEHLQEISFNFCNIDSKALQCEKDCSTILSLSLNHTKVSDLSFLVNFPNLQKVGLKNTSITSHDLVYLKKIQKVNSIELYGTNVMNEGLAHIKDLNLTHISLPGRHMIDDVTISLIKGFEISSLDLSDCRQVSNACLDSLSTMKSLITFSLSNTRITDESLFKLKEINLEELDLSKTSTTNYIGVLFKEFRFLHTLNLAWTNIDDGLMLDVNKCTNLVKLNLSHTTVTNKGIVLLNLTLLHVLILDWTEVTWEGARICMSSELQKNLETAFFFYSIKHICHASESIHCVVKPIFCQRYVKYVSNVVVIRNQIK